MRAKRELQDRFALPVEVPNLEGQTSPPVDCAPLRLPVNFPYEGLTRGCDLAIQIAFWPSRHACTLRDRTSANHPWVTFRASALGAAAAKVRCVPWRRFPLPTLRGRRLCKRCPMAFREIMRRVIGPRQMAKVAILVPLMLAPGCADYVTYDFANFSRDPAVLQRAKANCRSEGGRIVDQQTRTGVREVCRIPSRGRAACKQPRMGHEDIGGISVLTYECADDKHRGRP